MAAARRKIEFWYEFASTYSYLSVMRIEELAASADVDVEWRPFLLGPLFMSQGWNDSPFNLYPAKGRYMWRDLQRLTASRGLPFKKPQIFPANGLYAARIALIGAEEGWVGRFTKEVFLAQFRDGAAISDTEVLTDILNGLALDGTRIVAMAQSSTIKEQLRNQTERARDLGIFGAPSFITEDGELFWGDDHLQAVLIWPETL